MINIWWNKYYGFDEKYPNEDNYRVISAYIGSKNYDLICVWKRLSFYLAVTEDIVNEWDELEGPPKKKWYKLEILKRQK